jgi:hypothetical protein
MIKAEPIFIAFGVGAIGLGHQRMAAPARGIVQREIGMNRLGQLPEHLLQIVGRRAAIAARRRHLELALAGVVARRSASSSSMAA